MKLSVVVTAYNEEENIRPLFGQLSEALKDIDYEVIAVDDGSIDGTLRELKAHASPRVKVLALQRNYGQTAAMAAGIEHAEGECVATMDGDLQNDPRDLPMMLALLHEGGFDVVAGNRKNRRDSFMVRKIPSRLANVLIRNISGVHIHDYGCSLKVFRRDIAKNLGLYGELHRFIPILAHLQGARIAEVDVRHHPRLHGVSKYGLGRTLKVVSDLLLMMFFQKYMQRPMHLFGAAGILAFLAGLGINLYLLVEKILGHDIWGRPILILGVLLLLGGIQLITVGFVAEMIVRTYFESQNKKTYLIREIIGG